MGVRFGVLGVSRDFWSVRCLLISCVYTLSWYCGRVILFKKIVILNV